MSNDLPGIFKKLSELDGYDVKVDKIIKGGCGGSFSSMIKNHKLLEKIKKGKYNYVVMQSQTDEVKKGGPMGDDGAKFGGICPDMSGFFHYGRQIIKTAIESGAIPVMLAHYASCHPSFRWPPYTKCNINNHSSYTADEKEKSRFTEADDIERGYAKFLTGKDHTGKQIYDGSKVILAPASRAWGMGNWKISMEYLKNDYHHPNKYGSTSMALTIFSAVFGKKFKYKKGKKYLNNFLCKKGKNKNLKSIKFMINQSQSAVLDWLKIKQKIMPKLEKYPKNSYDWKYEGKDYYNGLIYGKKYSGYKKCQ